MKVVNSYSSLYSFSTQHNILAIVWDSIQQAISEGKLLPEQMPPRVQKIQMAVAAEQIEKKYEHQKTIIAKLAQFFEEHGIKMMILKGYGLSLAYPVPNHRSCSDVDIWLFEERQTDDGHIERYSAQQKADKLIREQFNINIDEGKHHHTVFYVEGVMIENHYDFINIHAHLSNRVIESRLQQLTQQPLEQVRLNDSTIYLPSPDFHALFLLRHSASHFAAERISIRHLLDWRFFVEKYSHMVDWQSLREIATQTNMHQFLDCLNAICIDHVGMSSNTIPQFERNPKLEERVWNEILNPEFNVRVPKKAGYVKSWVFMFRRWWTNRWKHRMIYNEGLLKTFFVQLWSHLLKPKSLKL